MAHYGKGPFNEATARRYGGFAEKGLDPLFDATRADLAGLFARPERPLTILDVGAGPGVMTARMAELFPNAQVTGVDPSAPMLAMALPRASARIEFVCAPAEALPVADQSIDLVVSHNAIKHWQDRPRGISEILRVLKPGGAVWLCEIDRRAGFSESRRWCAPMVPSFLSPAIAITFKFGVARHGVTLDDMARLADALDLESPLVGAIPRLPILRLAGRRSA